jgi:O-antigen ligase
LDNQYLVTTIDLGFVGLIALLALLGTAIVTGIRIRRAPVDPRSGQLGQALAASVAASACSLALYDGFSFPMAASLLFVVLGCVACLRRVSSKVIPPIRTRAAL